MTGSDGRPARVVSYRHSVGDYLRAALGVRLRLLRCEEPVRDEPSGSADTSPHVAVAVESVNEPRLWPWCPEVLVPQAWREANAGVPAGLIWHFQL